MLRIIILICLLYFNTSLISRANEYIVDNKNSQVNFQIEHLKFNKVKGKFTNFNGIITIDLNNLNSFYSKGKIKTESINTAIKGRDQHLRSKEIFDIQKFPEITFETNTIKEITKNKTYEVSGNLSIKGISKPIKIKMTLSEISPKKITLSGTTVLRRSDFGIKWSNLVENGNLVGDQVYVNLLIKAVS